MEMTFEEGAEYLQKLGKNLDEKMKADAEKVKTYAENQEQVKKFGELNKELYDEKRGIVTQIVNATQHAISSDPDGLVRTAMNAYNAQERIKGLKDYVKSARGKFKQALIVYLTGLYFEAQKVLDTVRTVANTPVMAPQVDVALKQYHVALDR
jgi:hypothetical protein